MAVAPITSPIAAGMDAVDYSPWSAAAQARSALPGILNYVPGAGGVVSIPTIAAPYGGSPLSTVAGPDAGDGGTTAGLPMPDVEGYKYVYPRWTWDGDAGWTATIETNKQSGTVNEFVEKEGKWFNYIKGEEGVIDTTSFNFQGIGTVITVE